MIKHASNNGFYILQENMCAASLLVGWGRISGLIHIHVLHSSDLPRPHLISIPTHNHKQMKTRSDLL